MVRQRRITKNKHITIVNKLNLDFYDFYNLVEANQNLNRKGMKVKDIEKYEIEHSYDNQYRLYYLVNGIRSTEIIDALKINDDFIEIKRSQFVVQGKPIRETRYDDFKDTECFKEFEESHTIIKITGEDQMYAPINDEVVLVKYVGITYKSWWIFVWQNWGFGNTKMPWRGKKSW